MSSELTQNRPGAEAANAYAQSNIENAPPVKIVRLLYQGAIRFLDSAASSNPRASGTRFHEWLGRAEDIVMELRLSLDSAPAPEIAGTLTDLYLFVEHEIGRARREQSIEPLAGARRVLATLLEAWTAIDTHKA